MRHLRRPRCLIRCRPLRWLLKAHQDGGVPPIKQKYQLSQTSESVTAKGIQEKINVIDTEDAVKYFPSLFVRKRNNGDTQPVLATRTSGVGASARSLVYADDILLSALIANNNTIGAPRWGLITPEEIQRVDFLYGPFSAAYPGNSAGGVLLITTRMPDKLEMTANQTEAFQTFDFYKTKGHVSHRSNKRLDWRQAGPVFLFHQRQFPEQLQPAAGMGHDRFKSASGRNGRNTSAQQNWGEGGCRWRRRLAAYRDGQCEG